MAAHDCSDRAPLPETVSRGLPCYAESRYPQWLLIGHHIPFQAKVSSIAIKQQLEMIILFSCFMVHLLMSLSDREIAKGHDIRKSSKDYCSAAYFVITSCRSL